jgi:hypothetical protein
VVKAARRTRRSQHGWPERAAQSSFSSGDFGSPAN